MKKRIFVLVIAMIIALGVVEVASASSVGISINFTFTNILDSVNSKSGKVTADASSYYVVLDTSSTVAANNVFGFRARTSGGATASSYKTMNYVGKKTVSYRSNVDDNTYVYLRAKKDDSSTYGGPLNANGSFIP